MNYSPLSLQMTDGSNVLLLLMQIEWNGNQGFTYN